MNWLARRAGGVLTPLVWALIVVQFLGCNSMIYMAFGMSLACIYISEFGIEATLFFLTATGHMFIVDGAPTRGALAATNGLVSPTLTRAFADAKKEGADCFITGTSGRNHFADSRSDFRDLLILFVHRAQSVRRISRVYHHAGHHLIRNSGFQNAPG